MNETAKLSILMIGNGTMGKCIKEEIEKQKDMEIAMIIDHHNINTLTDLTIPIDLVIDFSHPSYMKWLYPFLYEHHIPYVCGTTGYTKYQLERIKELSQYFPIIKQANFSFGINAIQEMLHHLLPMLENQYDIEIVEKHHKQKKDAPSGTAKMFASIINADQSYREIRGRNGRVENRQKEIGIHSIRGGSIAGEHSIYFFGNDEIIEIKHTALSRKIFAHGAIQAAYFLINKEPGLYQMKDMLGERYEYK